MTIESHVFYDNNKELETDRIINRKIFPVVPPKVECSLTSKGEDLRSVLDTMRTFGNKYEN